MSHAKFVAKTSTHRHLEPLNRPQSATLCSSARPVAKMPSHNASSKRTFFAFAKKSKCKSATTVGFICAAANDIALGAAAVIVPQAA